ncbi:hypothetical protein BS17DRAFT_780507 [Gyrodon lividus]|nr:hypothetical protein BS17DRAFT_780507 [Gyrodon lividus]
MFAVAPLFTVLTAAALYVRADPNPTNPGPGDVFIQGQTCTITWDADTTGLWKNMSIELMTGDNFNMVYLTTVGTVDGTDPTKTSFAYTCPQVTPYSPIYFYQLTATGSTDKTWTGRFTITDTPADIVPPAEPTQPDGSAIPWGIGSLVGGASSVPQPSGAPGTASATGTALGGPSILPTTSSASGSTLTPVSGSGGSSTPSVVTSAASTPSAASGQGTNGAMTMGSVSNLLWQTALALGVSAVGFTVMF